MQSSFRLLTFNVYDKVIDNEDGEEPEENDKWNPNKQFTIQMFSINENGETASIFVNDFNPYFYVKVDSTWTNTDKTCFISQLNDDLGKMYENTIVSSKFKKKKNLYGFDCGKYYNFIKIKFKNEGAMKKAKNLWYKTYKKNGEQVRELDENGYEYGEHKTYLYEAHIPPLLRMFHIKEISPSGWVSIPNKKKGNAKNNKTSCKYEYNISYKDITPLPEKETIVPYKICSFDIEASSSHGDFPLAKKDYKKLATNIVDVIYDYVTEEDTRDDKITVLKEMIYTAFKITNSEFCEIEDIDIVYPQVKVNEHMISNLFDKWIHLIPSSVTVEELEEQEIDYNEEVEHEKEGLVEKSVEESGFKKYKPKAKKYKKKATIVDLLYDKDAEKETKIMELNRTLNAIFPKLEGDIVTFIGSTFIKYGEDKPYLNHCIVKDKCSSINSLENCVLESYKTEKEVLLAWTNLIQREDPDIVIGYNIFGFDYLFMYERAVQLKCIRRFMKLSRNKNESSLSKRWDFNKRSEIIGLEKNSIFIASGQHDINYINMNGRLQIDLYNYFRREYQLTKYKLDYVSGYFIGDYVKNIEHIEGKTKIYSKNLTGLENNNFVNFEEEAHSIDYYKQGKKFEIDDVNEQEGSFWINSIETPDLNKKVKWCLAKDDVTPQDIFRLTNEGPDERAIVAKYCIQDCNICHHLMRKIDIITGFIEMANLCSVPLDFLVMRGQGIKLTSYIAKKCREKETLMPVIDKSKDDEGYEGAIVLPPKCDLYLDDPVACVDYSSLYPSSMISENISHDSKVLTKEYDLQGNLIKETGERDNEGNFIYDNLPDYKYVNIKYDTYVYQRKGGNPKAAMEKVIKGYKICRFAQFPEKKLGILPAILEELLAARKSTRKLIPLQKDPFMANILDKRQLSIKVTANSMYGQTGAKTSTFYEKDCAASTTAIGRKLLTYAQRVIEEGYKNRIVETKHGNVKVDAEYVYGDTDSVFFKFNPRNPENNEKIIGKKALEITIELAQQAGELATKFLKKPHDLEYEKTFLPFCLLSKKRYVGMLYEHDPNKGKRKSMGIVLKRRDNAPIVKDIYGGVIDILMKDKDIEKSIKFTRTCLERIIQEDYPFDKFIITKSLRSGYKNPKQIAHKVLADRIGRRDPGNKPSVGDRVAYLFIKTDKKNALQGEKIETLEFIQENQLAINYEFYITNQIMKPLQQVFCLVLEKLNDFRLKKSNFIENILVYKKTYTETGEVKKEEGVKNKDGEYIYDNQDDCVYDIVTVEKTKKVRKIIGKKRTIDCIPYIYTETKTIVNYKDNDMFKWKLELEELKEKYPDPNVYYKKLESLRNKEVKALIFDEYLNI